MVIRGRVNRYLVANTDTDTICPAMFLKRTVRGDFEQFAFLEKRYLPSTKCEPSLEKKDFVLSNVEEDPNCSLNHPNCQKASFLLTWNNFGCGSSRENAVWALANYKVIIGSAPKGKAAFADIFRENCRQNLIWTPVISAEDHQLLCRFIEKRLEVEPVVLELDIGSRLLRTEGGEYALSYQIPEHHAGYILAGKTPTDLATEQIETYLPEIDRWSALNNEVLRRCPSVTRCAKGAGNGEQ